MMGAEGQGYGGDRNVAPTGLEEERPTYRGRSKLLPNG